MDIVKKYAAMSLLAGSIVLFSGCNPQPETPTERKINQALPAVESSSVLFLSDYTSVALEWKAVKEPEIQGYYIYRSNMNLDGTKMRRVKEVHNKYSNHYLDKDLEPNMKYAYRITTFNDKNEESTETEPVLVQTLPLFESVSLLEAISNLPRQIKIQWRPHTDPRISHYLLETSDPQNPKWRQFKKVEGRYNAEYIQDDLGDNEVHMYRIKAVTFDGIVSKPSEMVTATTKPLPDQVVSLTASNDIPKKIRLSWGKSPTVDVISYNIYRASSVDGSYAKLGTAPVEHNIFEDMIDEDGKAYFYKLTTVDKDGLESNVKDAQPKMGQTLAKPAMPIISLALQQDGKVILNWKAGDDRAISYNIYKEKVESWSSSEKLVIPNVEGLRFEDMEVQRGVKYKYSIQAVDQYGLVSQRTKESTIMLPAIAPEAQ